MLGVGARLPEVTVWTAPREATTLADVARGGAALFLFYLFDWSGT